MKRKKRSKVWRKTEKYGEREKKRVEEEEEIG